MNPYDFVWLDPDQCVARCKPTPHNQFTNGVHGFIEGKITTLTPLFIPQAKPVSRQNHIVPQFAQLFIRNKQNQEIIPGSSLKGLIRSVVETIGPGCWRLFDGSYQRQKINYQNNLPSTYKTASCRDKMCVACRLFGTVNNSHLLLGKVSIEDAVCDKAISYQSIYTPILSTPKPHHRAWYLATDTNGREYVAGRKYFFHADELQTERKLRVTNGNQVQNQYIKPLAKDNTFTFSLQMTNLEPDEWAALLYALVLERTDWGHDFDVRHKIGYAKPAGLGSIDLQVTKLTLIDYQKRYVSSDRGMEVYEGATLQTYINHWITPYLTNRSRTHQDLRRIWGWPPADVAYHYPDQEWFRKHSQVPISQTP